jgi:hypothetical protein
MQFQTCRTVAGAVLEDRLTINGGGDFIFDAPGLASQAAINGPKAALVTMGGALRIRGGASAGGGAARQNGGIWFGADQTTVNGAVLVPSTASGDTDSGITSIGDNDLTFYVNNQVSARATGLIWSKAGGGLWAALSDIRTKEKVNPYQKGIQEIASLTPISYRYTEASGMGNPREDEDLVGFSAQELDVLFPECVDVISHEGYEGGVLNADMSPLIPALVNAVKELDARLAAVEKRESAIAAWEAKREVASKASVDRRKEKRAAKVAKQADKFADRQARIEQRIADLKERGKK